MMLKSLRPVDQEAWRLHKEREMDRWLNDGVRS